MLFPNNAVKCAGVIMYTCVSMKRREGRLFSIGTKHLFRIYFRLAMVQGTTKGRIKIGLLLFDTIKTFLQNFINFSIFSYLFYVI